jgi:hypothetical protein
LPTTVLLQQRGVTVIDYRCQMQTSDPRFKEVHERHSLVRRGYDRIMAQRIL